VPQRTDNTIVIAAPLDLVWRMTNDLRSWPSLFSEYAAVDILEEQAGTVRFRLTMHPDEQGNTWSWVSERTPDVSTRTVTARRIETGWFEHMDINWEYREVPGGVEMRWIQSFTMRPDSPVDDAAMTDRLNRNTAVQMTRIKGLVEQAALTAAGKENPMGLSLSGHNVLVTGGTRGIGRVTALALARAGASVAVCHRTPGEAADTLALQLKELGDDNHVIVADVADEAQVRRLLGEVGDRLGSLSGVVANAGAISHIPFDEMPLAEWKRVIDTNLTGAFLVVQAALPLLTEKSSVVLIGSKVAQVGLAQRTHYTASKAALVGFARSLCKELGPRGVRVNVLAPGVIETEESAKLPAERRKAYESITALRRLGDAEEIAGVAAFLLSDLSSYVTGETINVDGGI